MYKRQDGGLSHLLNMFQMFKILFVEQPQGDFRNIRGLIADALHIGDHLKGGGDEPKVGGHRLLLKKQP